MIIQGDCIEEMKKLEKESVNMVMTSPPYWALRDYGTASWEGGDENCKHEAAKEKSRYDYSMDKSPNQSQRKGTDAPRWKAICPQCGARKVDKQLGLEPTFDEYISKLCDIFDECQRVLRKDGTCWVNIGDTYYGSSSYSNSGRAGFSGKDDDMWKRQFGDGKCLTCGKSSETQFCSRECLNKKGNDFRSQNRLLPDKCLTMIPMRFAIEMVNRGWILRNVIIWHKPNCMPSSVKDRFTVDFEYLFFFSKSKKYYFETQYEPVKDVSLKRVEYGLNQTDHKGKAVNVQDLDKMGKRFCNPQGRNKRTVWQICPQPFGENICLNCGHFAKPKSVKHKPGFFGGADISKTLCEYCRQELVTYHFAIYPEELCETPIKAGCPEFICKKCGNPKEAIFEPSEEYAKNLRNQGKGWSSARRKEALKIGNAMKEAKKHISSEYIHKGYEPTCNCNVEFEGGIVLDPFFGAGTTGLVALKQNKKFIGIELNSEYVDMAKARLKPYLEQRKLD